MSTPTRSRVRLRELGAAGLLLAGAATAQTVTLEGAAADPSAWRTYSVAAVPGQEGEPYLTLLRRSLAEATARELEARGYVHADEADPADLVVDFGVHTEQRVVERAPAAVTYVYYPTIDGLGSAGPTNERAVETETTLLVSVTAPRERRVVWEAARILHPISQELADVRAAAAGAMTAVFAGYPWRAGRAEPAAVEAVSALEEYGREAEAGDPGAQYLLGRMHSAGHGAPQDLGVARRWYERAAEAGHPGARASLGLLLLEGPVGLRDPEAAARWLRLAARQDVASAQFALGRMLLASREPSAETDREAARWLHLAAQQGLASAQTDYATLCLRGRGVEQDPAAAARWYRRAAEQGEPQAQTRLGTMLELGRGVEADAVEAATWYLLAANRGDAQALERLEQLAPRLEPGQLEEVERRALAWRPVGAPPG